MTGKPQNDRKRTFIAGLGIRWPNHVAISSYESVPAPPRGRGGPCTSSLAPGRAKAIQLCFEASQCFSMPTWIKFWLPVSASSEGQLPRVQLGHSGHPKIEYAANAWLDLFIETWWSICYHRLASHLGGRLQGRNPAFESLFLSLTSPAPATYHTVGTTLLPLPWFRASMGDRARQAACSS